MMHVENAAAWLSGSYPVSHGEHLISHYADVLGSPAWPSSFHGEQVGVATLAMASLQEEVLGGPATQIGPTRTDESELVRRFGPALGPACWRELVRKRLDAEAAEARTRRLAENWEKIRSGLLFVTRTAEELRTALARQALPSPHRPSAGRDRSSGRRCCMPERSGAALPSWIWPPTAGRLEAFAAAL
jgi:glycerol dehydrogenase-like iron-containing ADH family enzyme